MTGRVQLWVRPGHHHPELCPPFRWSYHLADSSFWFSWHQPRGPWWLLTPVGAGAPCFVTLVHCGGSVVFCANCEVEKKKISANTWNISKTSTIIIKKDSSMTMWEGERVCLNLLDSKGRENKWALTTLSKDEIATDEIDLHSSFSEGNKDSPVQKEISRLDFQLSHLGALLFKEKCLLTLMALMQKGIGYLHTNFWTSNRNTVMSESTKQHPAGLCFPEVSLFRKNDLPVHFFFQVRKLSK